MQTICRINDLNFEFGISENTARLMKFITYYSDFAIPLANVHEKFAKEEI